MATESFLIVGGGLAGIILGYFIGHRGAKTRALKVQDVSAYAKLIMQAFVTLLGSIGFITVLFYPEKVKGDIQIFSEPFSRDGAVLFMSLIFIFLGFAESARMILGFFKNGKNGKRGKE